MIQSERIVYTPLFLDLGLKAMIGKGKRSKEVVEAIVKNHAVYLAAVGGAGALLSKCIIKSETVCYEFKASAVSFVIGVVICLSIKSPLYYPYCATHIAGLPVAVNICCHVNRHAVRIV